MYSFWRSLHIVSQNGCTSLYFHQYMRFLFPTSSSTFVVVGFLEDSYSYRSGAISVWFYLHFLYGQEWWAFWHLDFFCWNVPFSSVAHFFTGSLIFEEFTFLSFIFFLAIDPLSYVQLANIFSHSVGEWSLQFGDHFFSVVQKLFNFMYFHLSILSLSCWATWVLLRKSLPIPIIPSVFSALSCTNVKV
jgi:hypothetical protein